MRIWSMIRACPLFAAISASCRLAPLTNPVVQEAINTQVEPAAARTYPAGLVTPDESVVGYYKPFPVGPYTWYAIVEQPTTDAFAQVYSVIGAGAILMLISVVAIVVTGFYISRRIMRPISILRQGASQLAAGKFDSRITDVKTGDELEFLADEFNDLASKLQVAQTSTAEAVREREEQYQSAQRRVREMSSLLKVRPRHHFVGSGECAGQPGARIGRHGWRGSLRHLCCQCGAADHGFAWLVGL